LTVKAASRSLSRLLAHIADCLKRWNARFLAQALGMDRLQTLVEIWSTGEAFSMEGHTGIHTE